MVKRSPILGYNHNVRYRGLVFHVQTEDSGILSPHLFTHLFHHGVIVSTRKLVYDSGSAEDSIKALMQAQHKAVLKDLKRGNFDDKIDEYLGGTPGLLPRDAPITDAAETADPTDPDRKPELARASSPIVPAPVVPDGALVAPSIPAPSDDAPALAGIRTRTAERGSAAGTVRTSLPTEDDASFDPGQRTSIPSDFSIDSSPEILIQLELDEPDDDLEPPRPADYGSSVSDGVPGSVGVAATLRDHLPERRPSTAVGASALPPARPITRPPNRPAISPPQVISRPLPPSERRSQDTDAIEVFAPAPPSIDLPPPVGGDRSAGQYSQHKRISERIPSDLLKEGRRTPGPGVPVPAGLGRPGPSVRPTPSPSTAIPRPASAAPPPIPQPPPRSVDTQPVRSRTPTPVRLSSPAVPTSRTASSSTGVVMTRPAVIVGAPAKPATGQTQRVRKAREDEGRGFGQGLISEKSLDEVILAYLSEDADDK